MKQETFVQQIKDLLRDMAIAALESLVSFFQDLKSFRNRLVVYIALLGLLVILYNKDAKVIISVVSIISIVFSYYFKTRIDSAKLELEYKEEKEEDENKWRTFY